MCGRFGCFDLVGGFFGWFFGRLWSSFRKRLDGGGLDIGGGGSKRWLFVRRNGFRKGRRCRLRVCAICAIVAFRVEINEAKNEFVFGAHGGELAPSAFRLPLNEALRVVASVDIITM